MSEVGYRRTYKMRQLVKGAKHISVAIPYEVIERQASLHNMTVADFVKNFVAIAEFNSFEGVHYTFQRVEDNNG